METTLSPSQVISGAQQQIAAVNRLIARLSRQLNPARRLARSVGACQLARQCLPGIEKLSEPSAINAQILQAKLVRARLQAALAAARRANFVPTFDQATFFTALAANRSSFERANQAIIINGLKSTMQTIKSKPGFDPAESTSTFRLLNRRLSLLTRARNRRITTPSSVGLLFSAPTVPVDAVRRVR